MWIESALTLTGRKNTIALLLSKKNSSHFLNDTRSITMKGSSGNELAGVSVTPAGAKHAVYWPCETQSHFGLRERRREWWTIKRISTRNPLSSPFSSTGLMLSLISEFHEDRSVNGKRILTE